LKKYKGNNLTGTFFISPKLDGICAHWTGSELKTRNNKPIMSCNHIIDALSGSDPMVGELYNHEMPFDRINGAARSHNPTDDSLLLKFYGHKNIPSIPVIDPTKEELVKLRDNHVHMGYEGIIITDTKGNMLKYKQKQDAEFKLIGFEPGKTDRNKDTFGSLVLKTTDGKKFKCSGISDKDRIRLWAKKPIGAMIKVSFDSLTKNGIPRFPSFEGIRWDI